MAGKLALVDYGKCDPGTCEAGVCAAALACPHRLLSQDDRYEAPMPGPAPCRGCGDCALSCPLEAIELVSG